MALYLIHNEFSKEYAHVLISGQSKDPKKVYEEILKEIEPELERNFNRWNLSRSDFEFQLERLKTYIEKRENYMIDQTKSFFNLTDEEVNKYFGD